MTAVRTRLAKRGKKERSGTQDVPVPVSAAFKLELKDQQRKRRRQHHL